MLSFGDFWEGSLVLFFEDHVGEFKQEFVGLSTLTTLAVPIQAEQRGGTIPFTKSFEAFIAFLPRIGALLDERLPARPVTRWRLEFFCTVSVLARLEADTAEDSGASISFTKAAEVHLGAGLTASSTLALRGRRQTHADAAAGIGWRLCRG